MNMDDKQYIRQKIYMLKNTGRCSVRDSLLDDIMRELSESKIKFMVAKTANIMGLVEIRRLK